MPESSIFNKKLDVGHELAPPPPAIKYPQKKHHWEKKIIPYAVLFIILLIILAALTTVGATLPQILFFLTPVFFGVSLIIYLYQNVRKN